MYFYLLLLFYLDVIFWELEVLIYLYGWVFLVGYDKVFMVIVVGCMVRMVLISLLVGENLLMKVIVLVVRVLICFCGLFEEFRMIILMFGCWLIVGIRLRLCLLFRLRLRIMMWGVVLWSFCRVVWLLFVVLMILICGNFFCSNVVIVICVFVWLLMINICCVLIMEVGKLREGF